MKKSTAGINVNNTGLRTLDNLGRDPRVAEIYRDSDGIWCELADGFRNTFDEPRGALHGIHENTVRDILMRVSCIAPCDCAECADRLQRRGKVRR